MKEYFGWVQGSDMASTYVHLSGRDLDNALLKLNNIEIPDEGKNQEQFSLQKCPMCKLNNPPNNKFCSRCGAILDDKKAREIMAQQLERQQAEDFMGRLIQDEEFQAFVDRKLKEIGVLKK